MRTYVNNMPAQLLSYSSKGKTWRKKCLDWGNSRSLINYGPVRSAVRHKKINYDLLDGIIHMDDLLLLLNPELIDAKFISDKITHYPIMNSKLNVLRGEEAKRVFDWKVVVTNPTAISEMENTKKQLVLEGLLLLISDTSLSEEEFNDKLEKLNDYFTYEYQDMRELRANCLLTHYSKEYNIPFIFNKGFVDGMAVAEEIYQCDIVGGEPTLEKLNPIKVKTFRSGYSNNIEDADVIILEDYWSPGKIIDTYYEVLTAKDIKYIENLPYSTGVATNRGDEMGNVDIRLGMVRMSDDTFESGYWENLFSDSPYDDDPDILPYDSEGNVRVMRMYWKSRKKIKKIKSYDPETGEEVYNIYTEDYVADKFKGEEETIYWINEAWEGTLIGDDIYVNMRPRPIQYNRMSNPSRCHFGIVGTIYNLNDTKPYSLVDMMKSYNYMYDVIHDRLNKLISRNWGKLVKLDLAKVPASWDIDKWLYFAKTMGLVIEDSFKEGNIGAASGKLAGGMNNASSGVVDAELGNSILQLINLLEFIKLEMSEVVGISKLREGLISNRETVGGVERATLLSSHITEWLFSYHDDTKKRVLECFLETAKIALRGRNKKFNYILPDGSKILIDIDGDSFSENDYGLVVDNSSGLLELQLQLTMLALAGLQNLTVTLATIMKFYQSGSLAEKIKMLENDETRLRQALELLLLAQILAQQEEALMQLLMQLALMLLQDLMNQRDNETKILIATMQALTKSAELDGIEEPEYSLEAKDKLLESMRLFDAKLQLDKDKLSFEKDKLKQNVELKKWEVQHKPKPSTSK